MLLNNEMNAVALPLTDTNRLVAIVLAALMGLGLLFGSGFAGADILHNAAHDGRHAAAFPCH